ncbi:MAG: DUF1611 domain-containing protein [Pseudomonadota bacterium]
MTTIELQSPYAVFLGGAPDAHMAKTGIGVAYWRPDLVAGQIRLSADGADAGVDDIDVPKAKDLGVQSLLIGVSHVGGGIAEAWLPSLLEAAEAGIDIVAGTHQRLQSLPELKAVAGRAGARLVDIRTPPADLPVGTGKKRTGKRLLTVGTDASLGKKYTALQLERDMSGRGLEATFRATGQTGIMIAQRGIPIDAVVGDFISGAAELLSPDNHDDHWDVIEGQGALLHPGYGSVTHGLLIGSQPDAFVMCHQPTRIRLKNWPDFAIPTYQELMRRTILAGSLVNPDIRCVGISINSTGMTEAERRDYKVSTEQELGLPCVDPLIDGTGPIVDEIIRSFRLNIAP